MGGFDPITLVMILVIIALFYFMLIRPQQKRAKKQQELMGALKPGDRVMTISGIVGTVRHLGEKQAIIEISPGVEMTVVKGAIGSQPVEDEFEYSDSAESHDEEALEPEEILPEPVGTDQNGERPDDPDGDGVTTWDNPK